MDKQAIFFKLGFSKAFELAFATALQLDDAHGEVFQALEGKVIELWIAPVKFPLFCVISHGKITTQTTLQGSADVTLKTGLRQLRVLAQSGYFENKFIRGDEALGEQFVKAMETIEIDWEEHLSHYTGDTIAFKTGHALRTFQASQQARQHSAQKTLREYLQFELELVPTQAQVNRFNEQVEHTQKHVEALEKRLQSLKQQRTTTP